MYNCQFLMTLTDVGIGEGGYGVVVKCFKKSTGNQFIVKIIR